MMRAMKTVAALAVALLGSATAQATVYDAVSQFGLAGNPNGVWSYGSGTGGSSFTLISATSTACEGFGGLSCYTAGLPDIGKPAGHRQERDRRLADICDRNTMLNRDKYAVVHADLGPHHAAAYL